MEAARADRTKVALCTILVAMLLMGCDPVWSINSAADEDMNAAMEAREAKERAAKESDSQSTQPQETAPSDQEEGALTGAQEDPATGPISAEEMAGTYSASAALQHLEEDVESPKSLPVTLQLNEAGTGTVNVNGYGGEAQCAGSAVSFFVSMEEDGTAVLCQFKGTASRSGSQIVITGNMDFSMVGVTFASYSWTAQK